MIKKLCTVCGALVLLIFMDSCLTKEGESVVETEDKEPVEEELQSSLKKKEVPGQRSEEWENDAEIVEGALKGEVEKYLKNKVPSK